MIVNVSKVLSLIVIPNVSLLEDLFQFPEIKFHFAWLPFRKESCKGESQEHECYLHAPFSGTGNMGNENTWRGVKRSACLMIMIPVAGLSHNIKNLKAEKVRSVNNYQCAVS